MLLCGGVFTDNATIIQIGASVIALSILLETGRTINITVINALRASGDARYPVKIGFISMICISLPVGYLLVFTQEMFEEGMKELAACGLGGND